MKIPPAPTGTPFGTFAWDDWYYKVTYLINNSLLNHNDLQGLQGGSSNQYYHLTSAQHDSIANLNSNTYTPTASLGLNMDSVVPSLAFYQKVGDIVNVWGTARIDPTNIDTQSTFSLSLPIASTLSGIPAQSLIGSGSCTPGLQPVAISNNGFSNNATFSFQANGTGVTTLYYHYSYRYVAYVPPSYTFATWDPATAAPLVTLSGGNLTVSSGGAYDTVVKSTISKTTGKWYWEVTIASTNQVIAVSNSSVVIPTVTASPYSWVYYGGDGKKYNSGISSAYGATFGPGDVIGVAMDVDAGSVEFYKNGVSQGVAFTGAFTGQTMYATIGGFTPPNFGTTNFGATPFAYIVPSGYNSGLYT